MRRRQFIIASGLAFGFLSLQGSVAFAQAAAFPDRPVRIVVPFAAGNTLETALRVAAEEFSHNTGQQLVIEAKPGGAGIIAAQYVMNARADGYTLLLGSTSMLTINPHTIPKLPYDPERSFKPVTNLMGSALVFVVNAQVPANNLREFIAWTKTKPGQVSYASFTNGSASHFAGVILNRRAGIDMIHIPFNGTPPATQALVAGQVQSAFLQLQAVKPYLESGHLKAIAISSPTRSPIAPDIQTFHEQGYPELDMYIWASVMAPANTPDEVIQRLNEEFRKIANTPTVQERWRMMDFTPLPSTPLEFTRFARAESLKWAEAVKASGFRASE